MATGQRIVLVEDEGPLRAILARNLRVRGYEVVEAASGAAALAAMAGAPPALLVLDVNLPDLTGWEVLRRLPPEARRIPLVVCSAVPPHPKRVREFAGITFLQKPFPLDAFLRVVADALGAGRVAAEEVGR
ncbi:MAG TPA: response regulator [Thermomicrobiales bacterium]|nr:response regulator [Thermomicrobiales bacterium]